MSIVQLLETSKAFDEDKEDYGKGYQPNFHEDGSLWMEKPTTHGWPSTGPYRLTDHALGQLCARYGVGTFGKGSGRSLPREVFAKWLADEDYSPYAAALLNKHQARIRPSLFMRTYKMECRAILSQQYTAIGNTQMLKSVDEALGLLAKKAGRDVTPEAYASGVTPDNLWLRFTVKSADVLPENERTSYGFGVYISNNETGQGGLRVSPMIKRTSCNNSIICGGSDNVEGVLNAFHRGNIHLLADRVALAIGHSLRLGALYLNQLMTAREIELPDIFTDISDIAKQHEWSTEFTDAVRTGTEGQHSLYGLVNGITYAAHKTCGEQPEQQARWEMFAGAMLTRRVTATEH